MQLNQVDCEGWRARTKPDPFTVTGRVRAAYRAPTSLRGLSACLRSVSHAGAGQPPRPIPRVALVAGFVLFPVSRFNVE